MTVRGHKRPSAAMRRRITEGFVFLDRDFRILQISDDGLALVGRPADEIVGRSHWEVWPGSLGTEAEAAYRRAMSERVPVSFEHHYRSDRHELQLELRAHPTDGGLAIFFRDVTERKEAERRQTYLFMLNEQLRDLADPHAMTDAATAALGKFLNVAQVGYGEINEVQTHVTVHRDWNDGRIPSVVGTWKMDDFGSAFIREMKQGATITITDVYEDPRTCAPEVIAAYNSIATRSILDVPLIKGGRMVAMLFIHHPHPRTWTPAEVAVVEETCERLWSAVERARAERRLLAAKEEAEQAVAMQRRQLQELESIYASASVGLWLGDRECRFLRVNHVMAEINGLPVEAHIGKTVKELVPGVYDFIKPYYDQVLKTGNPVEFEVTGTTAKDPNAVREWVVAYHPLIDESGEVYAVSSVVREVTEERQAKRALAAAKEEAEKASRSKSKFLAAASHDLRQPLQSLFLFAAALGPHVDTAGRKTITQLERSLEALKSLLDSLLDVSKLDAGLVKPAVDDFPLNVVLDELSAAYRPVAEGRGLAWTIGGCRATVRSDRVLLGRLLRNLIENAIRYTEQGGIAVHCEFGSHGIRIEVKDSGIGIPTEHQERIFEEFHQVGNAERNRQQGLGLGLAIVRRIADLLGYRIEVRSEPGKGSAFAFSVPRGAKPAYIPAAPTAKPAVTEVGQERLALVIDDDVLVALGLQEILKGWGYTVIVATGADQAIDCLRSAVGRCPDVILADYRLGQGQLGTQVVARIREFCGRSIPGILLTGETGAESLREAAANGLMILHKPVMPKHLAVVLDAQQAEADHSTG